MAQIIALPMPNDILQMHLKELAGVDPDTIPGIERLWIWRARRDHEEMSAQEAEFVAEMEREKRRGGDDGA